MISVSHCSRGWFINDVEDIESTDEAGILSRLTSHFIKVSRNCNDGLIEFACDSRSVFLELVENPALKRFRWITPITKYFVVNLTTDLPFRAIGNVLQFGRSGFDGFSTNNDFFTVEQNYAWSKQVAFGFGIVSGRPTSFTCAMTL